MPIEFAYQVIKDLIALAKMEETDPIDPGTSDAKQLAAMGIIDGEQTDAYSWAAPRKLFARTEAVGATHDIVWVTDKLRRTKRKVVRLRHDDGIDLVLIVRKDAD